VSRPGGAEPERPHGVSGSGTPCDTAGVARTRFVDRRVVAYPVLFAALAVAIIGFWPGYFNADTTGQIFQLKTFDFTDWHSPLLMAAWRPWYDLGFGPGWLLGFTIVVVGGATYVVYRLGLSRLPAALAAGATVLYAPDLGMLGLLGRDAWFLGAILGCWACLVQAIRPPGRARTAWLAAAWLLALAMVAARQNAVVCLPVVAGAMVWLARRDRVPSSPRTRRDLLLRVGAGALVIASVVGALRVAYWGLDVQAAHAEQGPMLYDLFQLSERGHEVLLSPSYYPAQDRTALEQAVRPLQYDSTLHQLLEQPGALWYPVAPAAIGDLHHDWFRAVRDHPGRWLSVRFQLYGRLLGITGPTWWVYHPLAVDNPPDSRPSFEGPTKWTWEYLDLFTADPNPTGGPLHRVWVYLLVTAVAVWRLFRGPADPSRRLLALLGVASLIYAAGWFVGAMDNQFRFMYPNVVMGVVVAVAWAGLNWRDRRARRALVEPVSGGDPLEDEEVVEAELEPLGAHHV
jgi:hypothetical protein